MPIFEKFAEVFGWFEHSDEWKHIYTFFGYLVFLSFIYLFYRINEKVNIQKAKTVVSAFRVCNVKRHRTPSVRTVVKCPATSECSEGVLLYYHNYWRNITNEAKWVKLSFLC